MENTTKVMHLLDELEQVLLHAEASQENVVRGRNQRQEEINFMQLARDGKNRIHSLEELLDECVFPLDETRKVAKRMNAIWNEYEGFGKEIYAKEFEEWKRQIAKKESAAKSQIQFPLGSVGYAIKELLPIPPGWLLGVEALRGMWNLYQEGNEKKAGAKAREAQERYQCFKRTTEGFCDSFQSFQRLCEEMNQRLQQLEEEAGETEEKKRSKGGRSKSCWYAGSWDGRKEEVVRERLREIYSKTIDGLDGLKSGNRSSSNVWAALFFCAAKGQGIIPEKIRPNNVDYVRDLNGAGIEASKNSIKKYHTYCRLFHLGGEPDAGQLHSVSRWLELLRQKDTEAVKRYVEETHRSLTKEAEEWLADDAKGITIDRKFWEGLSHDYLLYSGVFDRIGGEVRLFSKKKGKLGKCRVNS